MKLGAKIRAQAVRLLTARYRRRMARIYETSCSGGTPRGRVDLFTVLSKDTLDRNPVLRAVMKCPDDDKAVDALVAQTLYLCRYPTIRARLRAFVDRAFYSAFHRFAWYQRLCEENRKLWEMCQPIEIDHEAMLRDHGYWACRMWGTEILSSANLGTEILGPVEARTWKWIKLSDHDPCPQEEPCEHNGKDLQCGASTGCIYGFIRGSKPD